LEVLHVETNYQDLLRLESDNAGFSALLMGIIESAPFQKHETAAEFSSIRIASRTNRPTVKNEVRYD